MMSSLVTVSAAAYSHAQSRCNRRYASFSKKENSHATDEPPLVFLAVCLILICWTAAYAQNNRSAVSLTGVDTASCTVPDPCRTFGTAISRTNAGGEIVVLSSAGYGPFTVNKS